MLNPNNDADKLFAPSWEAAHALSRARSKGVCTHERRSFGGSDLPPSAEEPVTCLDCGKIASWADLEEERREWL